jgi:hypothetical protein
MPSIISIGLKKPLAKRALFLAFQIDQRVACQINTKPLQIFTFLAEVSKTSKREIKEEGIALSTPNHNLN